jgi:ACS family tartrate transporter-like MFS transporter
VLNETGSDSRLREASAALPVSALADTTRRRVTRRLMPFLLLLYFFAYVDRTNVSIAKLGMERDLGFTDDVIGFGAGIFFVGYLLLEIPGTLLVERWSARLWLGRIMITWGIVATLIGFVDTAGQFYWLRFALGAAEAGFFPGVIVYLSHWYPAADRARAKSLFLIAGPVSQVLGLPLSRAILEHGNIAGLAGWRWVFVLEGLPSIMLGVITIFFLTDWPRDARWLEPAQREWLAAEIERERSTKEKEGKGSGWAALRQPQVYLLVAVYFFVIAGNQGLLFFLPSITDSFPLSVTMKTIVTMAPFGCAIFGILINGRLASGARDQRWYTAGPILMTALGLAGAVASTGHTALVIAFFCIAGFSAQAYLPAFWTQPSTLLTKSGAAVAIGLINSVGNLGGLAGPYLFGFLKTSTGSFTAGMWLLVACLSIAGLLATRVRARPHGSS